MRKTRSTKKNNSIKRKTAGKEQLVAPVSLSSPAAKKQEIASLMRRNEFWIGAAIIFVGLVLTGNMLYKNISQPQVQGEQAKKTSPTSPVAEPTKKLPQITKLANTSGLIKYLSVLPQVTPIPVVEVLSNPVVSAVRSSSAVASTSSNHTSSAQTVVKHVPVVPAPLPEEIEDEDATETISEEEAITLEPTAPIEEPSVTAEPTSVPEAEPTEEPEPTQEEEQADEKNNESNNNNHKHENNDDQEEEQEQP